MPPTPPPIIINMPATGAPWWGVPVLAGIFVIVGALVAYFSTKASDKRKAENEKGAKEISDTREAAEELLKVGREVENLVVAQETKTRAKPVQEYLDASMDLIPKLTEAWAAFELVSVKPTLKPGEEFFGALLVLCMPTADATKRTAALNAAATKRMNFINSLRESAGLAKIDRTPGQMVTREEFENTDNNKAKYLEEAKKLAQRHPPTPEKSKDDEPREPEAK